ncbi:MAG: immunoglobulin domain-containing protein [Verrucomicrobia bacterium]|nr:immunoglobulin domain-containing protein [Verrucomicrobiota bacterium]
MHGIALLADRSVRTWGRFAVGGSIVPPADATNIVGIASGSSHALALKSDGTVALWGRIIGNFTTQVSPEATNVVALGVGPGAQHALVLRADGTVVDWGLTATTNIPPEAFNIISVAAGAGHSLALRSDGRVVAWGHNFYGETSVPASATNIVAIATTWHGNIALRADGRLLTWASYPYNPNQVSMTNIVEVAGAGGTGMALMQNGRVVSSVLSMSVTNIMAIGASGGAYMAVKAVGPPIFPLPAVRRTAAAGQNAYFRLQAVGALPRSYQWSLYGTNLPGATNQVLVVTNVQLSKTGPYILTVSNSLGVAISDAMMLSVEPLEVTVQPGFQTVLAGSNATFTAATVGQGPFTYQWKYDGEDLPSATNGSLTLTTVSLTHAGRYSVVASNLLGGMTSQEATLTVLPLRITGQPQNGSVLAGTNVTFSVTLAGTPPFAYQWRFGGADLSGATESSLTLSNVEPGQAGTYSVIVSNAYGGDVSASATLNVQPLTITSHPSNVLALLWSPATFNVSAAGEGPFSYQWRFNGTDLEGATDNPLVLTNVQTARAGSYSVVVSNVYGSTSSAPATLSLRQVAVWGDTASRQAQFHIGLTNVKAIAAGYYHTLALRYDGTVLAWGSSFAQTNTPPGVTNIVAIAAGGFHNLGLQSDGSVACWGSGFYDSAAVPPGLSNVVAVAGGEFHSLALRTDGTVVAWGAGKTNSGAWPHLGQSIVPAGLSNVVAISAKGTYSLALTDDGTMVAWGANDFGQTNVPVGLSHVVSIAAGYRHGLALRSDGKLFTWGDDTYGQTNTLPDLTNAVSIAAGTWNSLALTEDNRVVVWGRNDYSQTNVPNGLVNVMAIAGGNFHIAALLGEELPSPGLGLASASLSPEGFTVSLPTQSGRVYRLEHKNRLSDENWIAHPLVAGTGGIVTFTDPSATGSQRFYRVRRW